MMPSESTSHELLGTIVQDFETLISLVEENCFNITGDKGLLPNSCLPTLNLRLSHPIKVHLKREQQFSYPHINALYLLCRTLGILQIFKDKSKRYLKINKVMLKKWHTLTTHEKYFNLMQSWLCRSDLRLIDRNRRGYSHTVGDIVKLFRKPEGSLLYSSLKNEEYKLYFLKLYNIALLEMFGLITVKDDENIESKSWSISEIKSTDFGKKLVKIFDTNNLVFSTMFNEEDGADQFHKEFMKFFPEWRTCLQYEKKLIDLGMHTFKTSLGKAIWRRIHISGEDTLDILAHFILRAFDFDNDHLYQFTYTDRRGILQVINHPYCEDSPYTDEIKIGEIDILTGDNMEFLFDFGDSWKFNVQLEKIEPVIKPQPPTVIEKFGKSPEQYEYHDELV